MDDEEAVREIDQGHSGKVTDTPSSPPKTAFEGVSCFEQNKDRIRLVVSDTDMPVMDGMTAVRAIKQIRARRPDHCGQRRTSATSTNGAALVTASISRNLGKPLTISSNSLSPSPITPCNSNAVT